MSMLLLLLLLLLLLFYPYHESTPPPPTAFLASAGVVYRGTFKYDRKDYVLKERKLPELGTSFNYISLDAYPCLSVCLSASYSD